MWLQISSGRGPAECQRAVYLFLKKYLIPTLEDEGIQLKILKENLGIQKDCLFSVLVLIEPENREQKDFIQNLEGSYKWIFKSTFRPNHKRKNWFFNCEVFQTPKEFSFNETDVKFQFTRSGGPGGQNVNKVETAVRAIHNPTGLSVFASEERSQSQNKKLALARLHKILSTQIEQEASEGKKNLWSQHNSLVRGKEVFTFKGAGFKMLNKKAK